MQFFTVVCFIWKQRVPVFILCPCACFELVDGPLGLDVVEELKECAQVLKLSVGLEVGGNVVDSLFIHNDGALVENVGAVKAFLHQLKSESWEDLFSLCKYVIRFSIINFDGILT